ncbi:hypothetical protein M0R04_05390 [Candidatus Dojkabacteria bacterium]|jgi:hypothetical protein|nr:hypothetical protein [Candidatus Dojkabacteria bacterium]
MKILNITLIILLLTSQAFARDLTVTFVYPVDRQTDVASFRLFRDGIVDKEGVPFDVRTFTTTAIDDGKDHIYTIQALGKFNQDGPLSTPTTLKWVPPTLLKPTYLKVK